MKTLYYKNGEANEEYWALLDDLKKNGKCTGAKWAGDYLESTYEKAGSRYVVTENMEYGTQYSIEKEEA